MAAALPHKHLALDQHKIDAAKRYWGVASEQEAADKALRPLKGIIDFLHNPRFRISKSVGI